MWEQCWLLWGIHWLLGIERGWGCRELLQEDASQFVERIPGLLKGRKRIGLWWCAGNEESFQLLEKVLWLLGNMLWLTLSRLGRLAGQEKASQLLKNIWGLLRWERSVWDTWWEWPSIASQVLSQLVKGADAWDSWDTGGGLAENWGNILDGINNKRYFFLG